MCLLKVHPLDNSLIVEAKLLRPPTHLICIYKTHTRGSSEDDFSSHTNAMDAGKAIVKNADMPEEMQQRAVDCAKEAMEQFSIEKDIAAHIKKTFDKDYSPTWHCIVGRNFGRSVIT